ncbi:MAG: hypothetical protein DMG06_25065 [Acidobacteria bacterium]|nr:MAG: hypothetical protein DMG06_25065 [Acidobacteriota bacterium]
MPKTLESDDITVTKGGWRVKRKHLRFKVLFHYFNQLRRAFQPTSNNEADICNAPKDVKKFKPAETGRARLPPSHMGQGLAGTMARQKVRSPISFTASQLLG